MHTFMCTQSFLDATLRTRYPEVALEVSSVAPDDELHTDLSKEVRERPGEDAFIVTWQAAGGRYGACVFVRKGDPESAFKAATGMCEAVGATLEARASSKL